MNGCNTLCITQHALPLATYRRVFVMRSRGHETDVALAQQCILLDSLDQPDTFLHRLVLVVQNLLRSIAFVRL